MFEFKNFKDGNIEVTIDENNVVLIKEPKDDEPKVGGLIRFTPAGKLVFYKMGMKHSLHYFRKYQAYATMKGIIDQLPEDSAIKLEVKDEGKTTYYRTSVADWKRLSTVDDFGHGTQYFMPVVHLKNASRG